MPRLATCQLWWPLRHKNHPIHSIKIIIFSTKFINFNTKLISFNKTVTKPAVLFIAVLIHLIAPKLSFFQGKNLSFSIAESSVFNI